MIQEMILDKAVPCIRCGTVVDPGEPILGIPDGLPDDRLPLCPSCRDRFFPMKVERTIPVPPGGKYLIIVQNDVPTEAIDRMHQQLNDWYASDSPFLWMKGDLILVRINGEKEEG